MLFDIVIPLGPNEKDNINKQIEYTKKNVTGYRNIYIIAYDPTITIPGCTIIPETIFPFSIQTINDHFSKYTTDLSRSGWYLQQLLKLYAGTIIPGILETYLIIDADVFFLKPIQFIEDDKYIFTIGDQYHYPYFDHMKRLSDTFTRNHEKSGIAHHMIFHTPFIREIFNIVETNHKKPFYNIFIGQIDEKIYHGSSASEYEIYFHYMIKTHSNKIIIRDLNWDNVDSNYNLETPSNKDYISICHYR
jgi:hypothetical protein